MMFHTEKNVADDVQLISHRLLHQAGFMKQVSSGIYTLTPLAQRVMAKIAAVVREEMDAIEGQEVLMPILQPQMLWQESGRLNSIQEELVRLRDRKGQSMVLAMTHEEAVTDMARQFIRSYRQLPQMVYQLQTKVRDEPRPRGGLVRLREFMMKDAYSFHTTEESLQSWYVKVAEAYTKFYQRCGVNALQVQADSGMMGGLLSHEYMVVSSGGEDTLLLCSNCGYAANIEVAKWNSTAEGNVCAECQSPLETKRGIEVGNIFQLGTKYSSPMKATFADESGLQKPLVMGCYGIGLTRMIACIVEENHDDKGIIWPPSVTPFGAHLLTIGQDAEVVEVAEQLHHALGPQCVLFDDRAVSAGVKLTDADLLGMPWRIAVSTRSLRAGGVELSHRKSGVSEIVSAQSVAQRIRVPLM